MTFQWPSSPKESALEFFDLSHPWGHGVPAWPKLEDVKIERLHGMAKSRVLTQKITTVMHSGTHIDAPAHVVEGAPCCSMEIPLSAFFGTGVVMSIPKKKWEVVTPDDLEAARPEIQPGDIVIVNTLAGITTTATARSTTRTHPASKKKPESGSRPEVSVLSARTPRRSTIRWPPPSARTALARHRAACCPGRSPNTKQRPAAGSGMTSPNGSRATGPSCPAVSTALRTSAVTWTR